jgi:hypothetical protein
MSDASQWKERSNSEWFHSQNWTWSTMISPIRQGIHSKYTDDLQSCQFRRGEYTLSNQGVGPFIDQMLDHRCQPWPHILDALQTLAAHLVVDAPYIHFQILDRPRCLAIGSHPLSGRVVQLQGVSLVRQRLDN